MLLFLMKHYLFSLACLYWSGQGRLFCIPCWGLLKLLQVAWVVALVLSWRSPRAPCVGPIVSSISRDKQAFLEVLPWSNSWNRSDESYPKCLVLSADYEGSLGWVVSLNEDSYTVHRVWPDKFWGNVELFSLISGDPELALQSLQKYWLCPGLLMTWESCAVHSTIFPPVFMFSSHALV